MMTLNIKYLRIIYKLQFYANDTLSMIILDLTSAAYVKLALYNSVIFSYNLDYIPVNYIC